MRRGATLALLLSACGSVVPAGGDDAGRDDAEAGAQSAAPFVLTDITDRSPDLAASPYGGAPGWEHTDKYAPGLALADLDSDGALDLVQPRNDRSDPALRSLRIHRGAGDGSFSDVTSVGWDPDRNATCALAFDHDGDDDLDLFIGVDGGPSVLLRNDGAMSFTDVAASAGAAAPGARVLACAASDIDADGDLDLYLGTWNASAPDHGPGTAPNLLLRNRGDGTFEDATSEAGVDCFGRSTLGLAFADLDGDVDQDLFVANDYFDACLFENLGNGKFAEIAGAAGVARGAWNGMGVAVGDLDNDGDFDLYVTDDEVPDESFGNALYVNRGVVPLAFDSRALDLGIDGPSTYSFDWLVCWGTGMIDLDLDADLDLHVATHGLRQELIWRNDGESFRFERALADAMTDVDGRGSAYGDIDRDGDVDVIVARRGAGLQVLRNDTEAGNAIAIVPRPLRAAPGAIITVDAGGRRQIGVVQAGQSYLSSGPPELIFGLGTATVAHVEVRFADGTTRIVDDATPGARIVVAR